MKIYKKILENGLTIALAPTVKVSTITAGFFVKVGGRNEEDSTNGISHFLEHMMFKGTKTRSSEKLHKEMSLLGVKWNAYTTNEETVYFMTGHPADLKKILDISLDIYLNSTLPSKEIELEKKVIIEERRMSYDTPLGKLNRSLYKKIFEGSGLAREIIGSEENIRHFTKKDFVEFKKTYYKPSNCVFVVAGNFNVSVVYKMIEKPLKQIKDSGLPVKIYDHEKTIIYDNIDKQERPYINIKKNTLYQQVYAYIAFPLKDLYNEKYAEIDVLSNILTNGMSSRLYTALRQKKGITYGSTSGIISYSDVAVLYIELVMHPSETTDALKTVMSELKKLKTIEISKDELTSNLSSIKVSLLFYNQTSKGIFMDIGHTLLENKKENIVM
jgi:predicted Zn-dependent peptidase